MKNRKKFKKYRDKITGEIFFLYFTKIIKKHNWQYLLNRNGGTVIVGREKFKYDYGEAKNES